MNAPTRPPTLAILNARIEQANAKLQAQLNSRAERLALTTDALKPLSDLKTLRVRYMTYEREIRAYRQALDTNRWQGCVIDADQRAKLEAAIEACEDKLTEIDEAVRL